MRIQIIIISPPGYEHAAAFAEMAETLAYGFNALGHHATIATNTFLPDALNVVLGSHMLPAPMIGQLPPDTVVYNLEQIEDELFHWAPQLKDIFARFEVWDYSLRNIARLGEQGLASRIHHLPVGTMPELTRIKPAQTQDIDVLFYGVVSERRRVILKAIQDSGLNVAAVFGCYGAARDALIARAKLVLSLHKHEAQVFEVVRVSYLLANRKAVVAEVNDTTAIDSDLYEAVAGGPPDA
ncbi:MAG: hypothetical protein J0626_07710, partial [Rhodospirillaceae bacterium]|nr:hypothetical protein [Rhodospirillaceae bacterium]